MNDKKQIEAPGVRMAYHTICPNDGEKLTAEESNIVLLSKGVKPATTHLLCPKCGYRCTVNIAHHVITETINMLSVTQNLFTNLPAVIQAIRTIIHKEICLVNSTGLISCEHGCVANTCEANCETIQAITGLFIQTLSTIRAQDNKSN